jgi:hypothetical protein
MNSKVGVLVRKRRQFLRLERATLRTLVKERECALLQEKSGEPCELAE